MFYLSQGRLIFQNILVYIKFLLAYRAALSSVKWFIIYDLCFFVYASMSSRRHVLYTKPLRCRLSAHHNGRLITWPFVAEISSVFSFITISLNAERAMMATWYAYPTKGALVAHAGIITSTIIVVYFRSWYNRWRFAWSRIALQAFAHHFPVIIIVLHHSW